MGFFEHELKPFLTSNPRHEDGFDPPAVDFERSGSLKNLKLSNDGCRRFPNLPVLLTVGRSVSFFTPVAPGLIVNGLGVGTVLSPFWHVYRLPFIRSTP